MPHTTKKWILLALMVFAAVAAWAMRPTHLISETRSKSGLEQLIPTEFGQWRQLEQSAGQIVNPQQSVLLKKLYTQTLSRTYVDADGSLIMLSIAYGANQSDNVALHYPEICYPAQGFQLQSNVKGTLKTNFGPIAVKRLTTSLGNRSEPITYWATLGDKVVQSGLNTKLSQIEYGLKGQIPDGLIFRVSSITADSGVGFASQQRFVSDLIDALPAGSRTRIAGLGNVPQLSQ